MQRCDIYVILLRRWDRFVEFHVIAGAILIELCMVVEAVLKSYLYDFLRQKCQVTECWHVKWQMFGESTWCSVFTQQRSGAMGLNDFRPGFIHIRHQLLTVVFLLGTPQAMNFRDLHAIPLSALFIAGTVGAPTLFIPRVNIVPAVHFNRSRSQNAKWIVHIAMRSMLFTVRHAQSNTTCSVRGCVHISYAILMDPSHVVYPSTPGSTSVTSSSRINKAETVRWTMSSVAGMLWILNWNRKQDSQSLLELGGIDINISTRLQ